jgi:hypothetical protein
MNIVSGRKRKEGRAGLPDGIFSNPKIPIWVNFGGPCNENVGICIL